MNAQQIALLKVANAFRKVAEETAAAPAKGSKNAILDYLINGVDPRWYAGAGIGGVLGGGGAALASRKNKIRNALIGLIAGGLTGGLIGHGTRYIPPLASLNPFAGAKEQKG